MPENNNGDSESIFLKRILDNNLKKTKQELLSEQKAQKSNTMQNLCSVFAHLLAQPIPSYASPILIRHLYLQSLNFIFRPRENVPSCPKFNYLAAKHSTNVPSKSSAVIGSISFSFMVVMQDEKKCSTSARVRLNFKSRTLLLWVLQMATYKLNGRVTVNIYDEYLLEFTPNKIFHIFCPLLSFAKSYFHSLLVFVVRDSPFSLSLSLSLNDTKGKKRRIIFSTKLRVHKKMKNNNHF